MKLIVLLKILQKLTLMCKECNIDLGDENDDDNDNNPEDDLMIHYHKSHDKLLKTCRKCVQRLYSNFHFNDSCTDKRTGFILPTHSYIDYSDINYSDDKDRDDDYSHLNKTLNEMKDNIEEGLKEYIRTNLKLEIINELKLEIKNGIKKNLELN